jgi:hypothetical protein
MLLDEEWKFLRGLVLNHWVLTDSPVATIKQNFSDSAFLGNVEITTGVPYVRASNLILAVKESASGTLNSPIITLIVGLKATATIQIDADLLQRLDVIHQKIKAFVAASAAEDPYSTYLLTGNRVFINRTSLRSSLKHLAEKDDKLVMRVIGQEQTGTSYTNELVMHLSATENFKVAYVNLLDFPTPRDAIRFLALAIKGDANPPEVEGDETDKWIRIATRWLISLAYSTNSNWWFVLDQCNHVQEEIQLMDMINRLAEQIRQNTRTGLTVRLLLLGHQSDLADEMRGRFLDNETRTLTQSDVRQALRKVTANVVAGHNVKQPEISPAELDSRIDAITTAVWEEATQSGGLIAKDLNVALEEAINEHFLQGL